MDNVIKWCTYSFLNIDCPQHIGKLKTDGKYGVIQYNSNRTFNEYWDMNYVNVFDNLIDAIKFFHDNSDKSYSEIMDDLLYDFSDDAKQINWKELKKMF